MIRRPPRSTLFPSPTLFRSLRLPLAFLGLERTGAVDEPPAGFEKTCRLVEETALEACQLADVLLRLGPGHVRVTAEDRKSTRLNSSHANISYAVFCLKKKKR